MAKTLRIRKLTLILTGILTLNSCWNNPSESDLIIGNYYVGWNDLVANRAIVEKTEKDSPYSSGIISDYVFAVGHNSDFIIAKQHPYLNDLTVTKYFIIDIKKRESGMNNSVIGPLEKEEFDKKRIELNISELKFDQNYPENPN
ncbi:DUF3997 domain-containing protein [Winogradskyella litoriviva]|uniref:DUF3997 domain-containing protein n=1 Tax=Winogradskyella litoriviva TaxID=1220182 RepID=A0ABX2E926_9FLAO|nr:DUF3997 domain-containing protein [Winogradskyella litoriviva]